MPDIIEGPPDADAPRAPLGRRLAWFVGLSLLGLAAVAMKLTPAALLAAPQFVKSSPAVYSAM